MADETGKIGLGAGEGAAAGFVSAGPIGALLGGIAGGVGSDSCLLGCPKVVQPPPPFYARVGFWEIVGGVTLIGALAIVAYKKRKG